MSGCTDYRSPVIGDLDETLPPAKRSKGKGKASEARMSSSHTPDVPSQSQIQSQIEDCVSDDEDLNDDSAELDDDDEGIVTLCDGEGDRLLADTTDEGDAEGPQQVFLGGLLEDLKRETQDKGIPFCYQSDTPWIRRPNRSMAFFQGSHSPDIFLPPRLLGMATSSVSWVGERH